MGGSVYDDCCQDELSDVDNFKNDIIEDDVKTDEDSEEEDDGGELII